MVDRFHLQLGYEVAIFIAQQGLDPSIKDLFVGPYITHLVRHMGILQVPDCMRIVRGVARMTIETLRSMGMLQLVLTTRGVEYRVKKPTDSSSTVASYLPPTGDAVPTSPQPGTTTRQDHVRHLMPPLATQTRLPILSQCSGGCRGA